MYGPDYVISVSGKFSGVVFLYIVFVVDNHASASASEVRTELRMVWGLWLGDN